MAQKSISFQDPDTKTYYKLTLDNEKQFRQIGLDGKEDAFKSKSLREQLKDLLAAGEVNEKQVYQLVFNHIKVERMEYDPENVDIKLHDVDVQYCEGDPSQAAAVSAASASAAAPATGGSGAASSSGSG